jgi:hypothetical protein
MDELTNWEVLTAVAVLAIPAWIFSRTVGKSGLSGWWALLGLVPLVNLVALWVFAFAEWPNFPADDEPPAMH